LYASLNNAFGQRFSQVPLRSGVTHYKEILLCPDRRTGTLKQQGSILQYLPFFGVFQSNTSQAKYRAAIAQQSVHSMYMRIKVQATPG